MYGNRGRVSCSNSNLIIFFDLVQMKSICAAHERSDERSTIRYLAKGLNSSGTGKAAEVDQSFFSMSSIIIYLIPVG